MFFALTIRPGQEVAESLLGFVVDFAGSARIARAGIVEVTPTQEGWEARHVAPHEHVRSGDAL